MSSVDGRIWYHSVLPSNSADRVAFDGSIPFGVSASGYVTFSDGGSGSTGDVVFSLIGTPSADSVSYGSAASHAGLVKNVNVELRDIFFEVDGAGITHIQIAVCDPSSFPSSDNSSYLYEADVVCNTSDSHVTVKVPDISHIAVVGSAESPLNVCVKINSYQYNGRCSVSWHGVGIVDD